MSEVKPWLRISDSIWINTNYFVMATYNENTEEISFLDKNGTESPVQKQYGADVYEHLQGKNE
jgi:hypothetical protein